MNLRLEPRSGVPIYVQIINQIKYLVASGQLEPGAQLPTIRPEPSFGVLSARLWASASPPRKSWRLWRGN
ncbi:MAG: hypothetical protein HY783_00935 [Chloroflexi bacterium]|nr:hypothetical protein [Chloroflexota bacterium]